MSKFCVGNAIWIIVCVQIVKAFLAQAKEEFTKKWDEPPQVCQLILVMFEVRVCK